MTRGEAKLVSGLVVIPAGAAAFFGLVWLLDSPKTTSAGNEALAMGVAVGALLGILYAAARFADWLYARFGPKEKGPA